MNKIFASISGGKTSGYMASILNETMSDTCDIKYVFANTGFEHEETLIFLNKLDKKFNLGLIWLEAVINKAGVGTTHKEVSFETATRWEDWRNGQNPFEKMSQKFGVPHRGRPHCTRELKLAPMYSYINKQWPQKDYQVGVGIRSDESHRMSKNAWESKILYPLINLGVDKCEVNDYWEAQEFNLEIPESHGNCLGCFRKTFRKLGDVNQSNPDAFEFMNHLENQQLAGSLVRSTKGDYSSPHGIQKMYAGWRNTQELLSLITEMGSTKIKESPDASGGCSEECGIVDYLEIFQEAA